MSSWWAQVDAARLTNCLSQVAPFGGQADLTNDLRQLHALIACDAPAQVEERLQTGQLVRVKGVVSERRGRRHLVVNVESVQRSLSVELDDFMVEKL